MVWGGKGRSGIGDVSIQGTWEDWDGLSPNGREYKNAITGETRNLSGAAYWFARKADYPKQEPEVWVNGKANIAAFAEPEQKPKDKKKKSVADSIDLAEKHFQRMEKLSIDLDEEYYAGEIDEERYELLRYKLDERLIKSWKRLEKESKPFWEAEDRKLGNDFECVNRATSHSKGMTMPCGENAYNSGKSLLKQHIAIDYSIIPENSVFSHLSDGSIFKIFAVKLLTAKRNVANMYTVVKQIVEEGLL